MKWLNPSYNLDGSGITIKVIFQGEICLYGHNFGMVLTTKLKIFMISLSNYALLFHRDVTIDEEVLVWRKHSVCSIYFSESCCLHEDN